MRPFPPPVADAPLSFTAAEKKGQMSIQHLSLLRRGKCVNDILDLCSDVLWDYLSYSDDRRIVQEIASVAAGNDIPTSGICADEIREFRRQMWAMFLPQWEEEQREWNAGKTQEQRIRWSVIPSVAEFLRSGANDMAALRTAENAFEGSADDSEWKRCLSRAVMLLERDSHADEHAEVNNVKTILRRYGILVRSLNAEFLWPRHQSLTTNSPFLKSLIESGTPPPDDVDPLLLVDGEVLPIAFVDRAVNVVLATGYSRNELWSRHSLYHDPFLRHVVLLHTRIVHEVSEMCFTARYPEPLSTSPAEIAKHEYCRFVLSLYQGQPRWKLIEDQLQQATIEELSHAITHQRLVENVGIDDEHEAYLSRIFRDGALLGSLSTTLVHDDDSPDNLDAFRSSISELTAQMRVCGLGPSPYAELSKWRHTMRLEVLEQASGAPSSGSAGHLGAAEQATMLLAEELGMISRRSLPETILERRAFARNMMYANTGECLALSDRLFAVPEKDIRLALKRIWEREFTIGDFDEPPFPQLKEDGTLSEEQSYNFFRVKQELREIHAKIL